MDPLSIVLWLIDKIAPALAKKLSPSIRVDRDQLRFRTSGATQKTQFEVRSMRDAVAYQVSVGLFVKDAQTEDFDVSSSYDDETSESIPGLTLNYGIARYNYTYGEEEHQLIVVVFYVMPGKAVRTIRVKSGKSSTVDLKVLGFKKEPAAVTNHNGRVGMSFTPPPIKGIREMRLKGVSLVLKRP